MVEVCGANSKVKGYIEVPLFIAGFEVAYLLPVVSKQPFASRSAWTCCDSSLQTCRCVTRRLCSCAIACALSASSAEPKRNKNQNCVCKRVRCQRESNADVAVASTAHLAICADGRVLCRFEIRGAVSVSAQPDASDDTRGAFRIADRPAFSKSFGAPTCLFYRAVVRFTGNPDLPAAVSVERANTRILVPFSVDRADIRILSFHLVDLSDTRIVATLSVDHADTRILAPFYVDLTDFCIFAHFSVDRADTPILAHFTANRADTYLNKRRKVAAACYAVCRFATAVTVERCRPAVVTVER